MGANTWHPTSSLPLPAPYRENTLKSFLRAVECGATFLEFDVQVCADGEITPSMGQWHTLPSDWAVYASPAAL
jgi:hypothetical protein